MRCIFPAHNRRGEGEGNSYRRLGGETFVVGMEGRVSSSSQGGWGKGGREISMEGEGRELAWLSSSEMVCTHRRDITSHCCTVPSALETSKMYALSPSSPPSSPSSLPSCLLGITTGRKRRQVHGSFALHVCRCRVYLTRASSGSNTRTTPSPHLRRRVGGRGLEESDTMDCGRRQGRGRGRGRV